MDRRLSRALLAILATAVLACGSTGAASQKADQGTGSGDNYLTANDTYGVGMRSSADADGAAGTLGDPIGGATLQP